MNTDSAIASIKRYISLNDEESAYFAGLLLPMKVKQGEFAEKVGEVPKYFIHVKSGCLMTYFSDKQATDHVIQFATAGWWTGDLHSFTKQIPSIYTTRALADSEVLLLPKKEMELLLEKYPVFERYFRIIFQNSLITHQHRLIQNFSSTADERYSSFQEKYPHLEQFVPLKYIASYLGITPEFLSKVRRRKMESKS